MDEARAYGIPIICVVDVDRQTQREVIDVLLLVFVTIALDAPDNLSMSFSVSAPLESSSLILT